MKRSIVLENILKATNNLSGPVVEFGFTDGKFSRLILSAMIDGIVIPRPIIMYGYFEKGGLGLWHKAADIVNESKNRLKVTSTYSNEDIAGGYTYKLKTAPPISIVNCYGNTFNVLNSIYDLLPENAIILLPSYFTEQHANKQIEDFVNHKSIQKEFVSSKDISYIKRGPVNKSLINKPPVREISPNLT